jgi:hypothetical protein
MDAKKVMGRGRERERERCWFFAWMPPPVSLKLYISGAKSFEIVF